VRCNEVVQLVVSLQINICYYCCSGCGMSASSDDKLFTLSGGDADFGSRTKNIFAGLESLEARHVAVESSEAVIRESCALMKPDPTDDFFSSHSDPSHPADFRVPSRPPPKRIHSSARPGYERNPSKWKRYDLSDVSDSQLTEQSNQKAANAFLNRFKVQPDDAIQTDSATDTKHVFRKPDKKPESKDAAKRPLGVKDYKVEDEDDVDETVDATRTQVLSFADDEPLGDSSQTLGSRAQFRRRRVKRTGDREARSHTTCSDDDDDDDDDDGDGDEAADAEVLRSTVDTDQRTADSESDSDNFDDLEEMGSEGEQEEEGPRDTESHRLHDNSASDVEKYAPEDVDLESID